MKTYIRSIQWAAIIAAACICLGLPAAADAEKDAFPLYPAIRSNVEFWKKVYSRYSTEQGIVHDREDLDILYEVIDLKHPDSPGAGKINQARIKGVRNKYIRILNELAHGSRPFSTEAKRVAALFGPSANSGRFREAVHNIRCQVGQKDRFRNGLIRSGAYLPTIRHLFHRHGLPSDLSYLPHVESSFNPAAYSKFGAAGIWQFIRSTGKRFMTVDYTVDERRDPILSSLAAAKLLKENYQKLGTWPLALTAYNHGAGGMQRAKQKHGDYETIFKQYQSRLFGFASRNFYSEFLAAREVAKNYKHHFGDLQFDRPEDHPVIVLPGYMAAADVAEVLNVDIRDIRRLNPSLREPVHRGEKYIPKGFRLRVPARTVAAAASSTPEFPSHMVQKSQKRSLFYRVEKGDTAGKIAKMHGVRLHDLILANHLCRRAVIYPGQNLRLPAVGEKLKEPAVAVASGKKTPPLPFPQVEPPPSSSSVVEAALSTPPEKVEIADASSARAKTESSPPEPVINPELVVGDLQIERVSIRNGKPIGVIQVTVEETIGHYADWLQVSAAEIRRLNGIRYGQHIRVHQKIKIPLHKISKAAFEEKRFEYHEELVQDFFNAFRVEQIKTYRIRKGDNIWRLCYEVFEVPIWLFQTYNVGLNLGDLQMSQPVRIPIVEKIASG